MSISRSAFYKKRAKRTEELLNSLYYSSDEENKVDDRHLKRKQNLNTSHCDDRELSPIKLQCSEGSVSENGDSDSTAFLSDSNSEKCVSSVLDQGILMSSHEDSDEFLFSSGQDDNSLSTDCEWESDSTGGKKESERLDLPETLRKWFVKFNISLGAMGALLSILCCYFPCLPKDPRTLIYSRLNFVLKDMGQGGKYFNFGLANKLQQALEKCPSSSNVVELNFHHDGLPISKSSNIHHYPILCGLEHAMEVLPPFVVVIYCGSSKPSLQEYLSEFVPELQIILRDGLTVGHKHYTFKIRCFICDAPAKSFIKGTKGHGGYGACDFCEELGISVGKVVYPNLDAKLRTHESFLAQSQREHHNEVSPLIHIDGLNMVSMFPLDYLHLILFGVFRTLMYLLFDGKVLTKLASYDISCVNQSLKKAASMWPSDFNRKPRETIHVKRWKATEYRQLLLYLCPGIFRSRMNKRIYKVIIYLHVAITILCRKDLYIKMNDEAHKFLRKCAELFMEIFGQSIMVYNFHNLIHLAKQCKVFGVLDSFSSFPYENYLGVLKRLTRACKDPLHNVVKRLLSEEDVKYISGGKSHKIHPDGPVLKSLHTNGPLAGKKGQQCKKYFWHRCLLSTRPGDNCVVMKNGSVVLIDNFVCSPSGNFIIGKQFHEYADVYKKPLKSSVLGIYKVRQLGGRNESYLINDIKWKGVLTPYKTYDDCFVVSPLLRTIKS